jgi:hypothetical protein
MKSVYLIILVGIVSLAQLRGAKASEWGCEVLLCAASSNPSWRSVAECHSPMERLIDAMKRPGFSWPTCPEGGSGQPGYEQYADCPAGWSAVAAPDKYGRSNSATLSQCTRTASSCQGRRDSSGSGSSNRLTPTTADGLIRVPVGKNGCDYRDYIARPRRKEPYYFDIENQDSATSSRHYFELRK